MYFTLKELRDKIISIKAIFRFSIDSLEESKLLPAWKLFDSSNNLIDSGGFDAASTSIIGYAALGFAARSTFSVVKCLVPGTYKFVIYDDYGDGMYTSSSIFGTYQIKNLNNSSILVSGMGNFGALSEHTFVIE